MARKKTKDSRFPLPKLSSGMRAAIGLVGGIALGAVGVGAMLQLVEGYESRIEAASAPTETAMVLVASRNLHPGVKISEDDLFVVAIPADRVVEGMIRHPEFVVGQYPRERILSNEFVRADRLSNPESGTGLNAIIPREMRALSIEVANGSALAGHLEPGNYVDVLATYYPDDDEELEETRTIVQGLFVLAVNERSFSLTPQEEREVRKIPRPAITLLVSSMEAERIAHAEHGSTVRLALRNDMDDRYAATGGVDVNGLLGRMGLDAADPLHVINDTHLSPSHQLRFVEGPEVALAGSTDSPEETP